MNLANFSAQWSSLNIRLSYGDVVGDEHSFVIFENAIFYEAYNILPPEKQIIIVFKANNSPSC